MNTINSLILAALACALAACGNTSNEQTAAPSAATTDAAHASALDRLLRPAPDVYSGGEPAGPVAFDELKSLGVRTIISVDGITPDTDAARERGIRYIHVPIGYDKMTEEARAALTLAMRDAERPIYVHCHHGKHRGPTALAVGLIGCDQMTNDQAIAFMQEAGTSTQYAGLWDSAREMQPISPEMLLFMDIDLPERAAVNSIAHGMAILDRALDNLDRLNKAQWDPSAHPDLVLANEASIIAEAFRAMAESEESASKDELFGKKMSYAWSIAQELEQAAAAEPVLHADVANAMATLRNTCSDCHAFYRN